MNACSSYLLSTPSGVKRWGQATTALTIRLAQTQDLHSLAEVLTHSFHPPRKITWWLFPILKLGIYEDLRSRIHSRQLHHCCLIASQSFKTLAQEENEIVGTVEIDLRSLDSWASLKSQRPYISNLAVKLTYRRQGIARKLLIKCEQIARDWGFNELALHVLENNESAQQLYLSSGYQVCRTEINLSSLLLNRPRRLLLKKQL